MITFIVWIRPEMGAATVPSDAEEPIAVLAATAADAITQAELVSAQRVRARRAPPGTGHATVTFVRPVTDYEALIKGEMVDALRKAAAWCGMPGCGGGCGWGYPHCSGTLAYLLPAELWPRKSGGPP